jgi:DNA repair photolyase
MIPKKHILYHNPREGNTRAFRANYYDGCSHGCKYGYGCCLAEKSRFVNDASWIKPVLVENALELLKEDLQHFRDKGEVFVENISDAYMPYADSKVTRKVLELLALSGFTVFLLSKNASLIKDTSSFFKEKR